MRAYSVKHLSDSDLLRELTAHAGRDLKSTALFIAHIAEVDARRLYLPAGYPSMFKYCVHELNMSEYAALKRIRVGRAARRVPTVFDALTDGRVHLAALSLLSRHLNRANAEELLAAATHRTKAEVELLVAQRFPKRDMPARIHAIATDAATPAERSPLGELAPGPVALTESSDATSNLLASGSAGAAETRPIFAQMNDGTTGQLAPGPVAEPYPKVTPLAPQRYGIQFTVDQETHDDLRCVQALLGHQVPLGDLAQVFSRALKLLRRELERTKFAATDRPRDAAHRQAAGKRTIPAHVRRAVNERDQGQCTFVGEIGNRCGERRGLEFDHKVPVARGGEATVENIRLRCRAHNQFEAEKIFGDGFMHQKREDRRAAAALDSEAHFSHTRGT